MYEKNQYYQIRIDGHISLDLSASFEDLTIQHNEGGQTILTGALPDQTALHGVLMRIRDLGLSLAEVKRIENPNQPQ